MELLIGIGMVAMFIMIGLVRNQKNENKKDCCKI